MSVRRVSAGLGVTAADLQAFNDRWMHPDTLTADIDWAIQRAAGAASGIEESTEVMGSMVSMYDLTHDRIYLDHLRE